MLELRMDAEARQVIEALGGTAAVAKLCDVSPQAVSQWKDDGFPKARRQFLALLRPELFAQAARPAESREAAA